MTVCAIVLGACTRKEGPESEFLIASERIPPTSEHWAESSNATTTVEAHLVRPELGKIGAVAADELGRLAVLDRSNCRITVLAADHVSSSVFGRCGNGPGDVRPDVVTIDLRGDTVVLAYAEPAEVAVYTVAGREIERLSLLPQGGAIADALFLSDSTAVLAQMSLSSSGDPLLSMVDLRTKRQLRKALALPTKVALNPNPRLDYLHLCKSAQDAGKFFAVQQWVLQTLELTVDSLRVTTNRFTKSIDDGGVAPVFPGRSVGQLRPRFRETSIVCNRVGTATWAKAMDWDAQPPRETRSYLEVRGYDGTPIYRGGNPPGVHPLAKLAAGQGSDLVFVLNDETPELWIVRLKR